MEEFDNPRRYNNNLSKYHVALKAMARHPEVCCLLLTITFILLSKYGYSIQKKSIIAPPRSPSRFFPPNSLITDFPYGAMEPVTNILSDNEFIFVMYYAPWCSKSVSGKGDFHRAARAMHGEVRFVSINCWWKEGDCRRRMKLPYFPQFYAYHTHINGFHYQGHIGAEHMVKFLDDLRFPLTYIFTDEQLREFTSAYQNTVVGYFDFGTLPEPPGFLQYYYAAMRVREQETPNHPRFAVIFTKKLAELFDFRAPNRIAITRRSNATVKLPLMTKLTAANIVEWVKTNKGPDPVSVVVPPGMKSLRLSTYLDRGPTLLHLTRVDPLYQLHHSIPILEKTAIAFKRCGDVGETREAVNHTVYQSLASSQRYLETVSVCDELRHRRRTFSYSRECCVSVVRRGEINGSQTGQPSTCEVCQHYESSSSHRQGCAGMHFVFPRLSVRLQAAANMCAEVVKNYNVNSHTSMCCGVMRTRTEARQQRRNTDSFVTYGKERAQRHECRKLRLHSAELRPDGLLPKPESLEPLTLPKSAGLGCKINRTVSFIVMDIKYQRIFAERLGVNFSASNWTPTSVTVLIDTDNERHSLLNETFSEESLDIFLQNFTSSLLPRFRRSEESSPACDSQHSVCVTDLTTNTFHSVVMDSTKDVFVLFYTSWCGFCASLSHVYLALTRYFNSAKNIIFTRINADKNDLPWEYAVDTYPTLIFFPAKRKDDSVVFPDNLPKTLPSLIKFVLRHSTQDLRIDTASDICSGSCIQRNKREVSHTIVEMHEHVRKIKRKVSKVLQSVNAARKDAANQKDLRVQLLQSQLTFLKTQLGKTEQQLKSAKLLEDMLIQSNGLLSTKKLENFRQQHHLVQQAFQKSVTDLQEKMKS